MSLKESSVSHELRNADYSLHLGESLTPQSLDKRLGEVFTTPPLPQLGLIQSVLLGDKALLYRSGLLGSSRSLLLPVMCVSRHISSHSTHLCHQAIYTRLHHWMGMSQGPAPTLAQLDPDLWPGSDRTPALSTHQDGQVSSSGH